MAAATGQPEPGPEPTSPADPPPDDELATVLRALVLATADVKPSRSDRRPKVTAEDAAMVALCSLFGRTIGEAAHELGTTAQAVRSKLPHVKRAVFTLSALGFRLPPRVRGPLFEQDLWDFTTVIGLPAYLSRAYRRMDFTAIVNPRWRLVAKEHAIALLLPGHEQVRSLPGARRTPLTLQTCSQILVEVTRWFNWLTAHAVISLDQVTDWHCDAYAAERSVRRDKHGVVIGEQVNARYSAVAAIVDLAAYRELFTTDRYPAGLRPFGGRTVHAVSTRQVAAGNKTPVVPAEILQPVLAAALYMVNTLGPHIIAEHRRRKTQLDIPKVQRRRARGALVGDLVAAVQRQVAEGRPLEQMPPEMTRNRSTEAASPPTTPSLPSR
jgi:hypothetical protein